MGGHERHADRYRDWPAQPQHEFIADSVWQEVAYGKNAEYEHGHHGNALLSRFPILAPRERGHLGAPVREPRHAALRAQARRGLPILHCFNVHLGLFERGRQWQIGALVRAHPRDWCRATRR